MWVHIFPNIGENSVYFRKSEGITLVLGFVVLALSYVLKSSRGRKLPPGPVGLPLFGYYPFLCKNPQKTLDEVAKKYGKVFGLYLGPQYVVFLNDWKAVKEALNQNATLQRPSSLFAEVPYNFGVSGANGAEWVQTRRLSSKAIKDIGVHNGRWEKLVQENVFELVKIIQQQGDGPVEVEDFFKDSFANSIITLILGEQLHAGRSLLKTVTKSMDAIVEYTPTLGMMNFSPTLSKILQVLGIEKKMLLFEEAHEFAQFVSNTVDERIKNLNLESEDSFISRFQEEIQNHRKSKVKTYITDDALKGSVIALLTGGGETCRSTIIWTLIALAENPDIQKKVHEELDRVIGREGTIRWPGMFKVPYTHATILESMRWATLVPLTATRIVTEDIKVQGYHIPKGTFLTTNNWSLHNDPRYWKNPDQFIPERFLLEEGKKVNTAPESFNPFSYGKRNCQGKLIALMQILQYVCILMQKFKVLPKEGNKVKHGTSLGLTYRPTDVELRFVPR